MRRPQKTCAICESGVRVVDFKDERTLSRFLTERLARFHTLIQQDGLEPPQVSQWGKRTLAYPIKKHDTGYYVVAKFEADATALPEFERAIKLDEGVLRFLVVVNEGAQPVPVTAGKSDEEDDE